MPSRCRWLAAAFALAACALILPSCASDGHLTILGYSTKPNYDPNIRTVRVPVFKNRSMMNATPVVGMEMDLTRAVVREIEQKTPFKVVQDCDRADTELRGIIVNFQKVMLNYTAFNEVREAETQMTVQLIWRDLRDGRILSRGQRRPGEAVDPELRQPLIATPDSIFPPGGKPPPIVGTPLAPESQVARDEELPVEDPALSPFFDPITKKPVPPTVVTSVAHFRPELGESITTALQRNYARMATQIVSLMETGW
jgi:hypothetical protein